MIDIYITNGGIMIYKEDKKLKDDIWKINMIFSDSLLC